MIKRSHSYIKESASTEYNIGDHVVVNGNVDGKIFNDFKGTVSDKAILIVFTDRDENGKCKYYKYKGISYYIIEEDWWVSPYNLSYTKMPKKIYSKIDPYGEENWEEEITETLYVSSLGTEIKKLKKEYDIVGELKINAIRCGNYNLAAVCRAKERTLSKRLKKLIEKGEEEKENDGGKIKWYNKGNFEEEN
jgi:hypothetical protein